MAAAVRSLRRGPKIGARLFQLPRRRFIRDRGQELAFLDGLADGAASGGKFIRQLDEAGVLRAHMDDEGGSIRTVP